MRTRLLINLVLLLGVLALGAFYWFKPATMDQPMKPISTIERADIERIRVERPDEPTIDLEKQNDDWRLLAPLQADAEDSRVGSILLLPLSASESRFPAAHQQLAKFGLEPAQLTITFDSKKFVIGDASPLNDQQRYVLYDDHVHLIDSRLYQRLNAPLTYYVNPSLTPPDSQLTRIRLPDGVLSQRGEEWHVVPERLSDSPDSVAESWQTARATYVKTHDSSTSEYSNEVTLEFAEHESISYRIVETMPQIILAQPEQGLQYHLRSDMAEDLLLVEMASEDTPPDNTDTVD